MGVDGELGGKSTIHVVSSTAEEKREGKAQAKTYGQMQQDRETAEANNTVDVSPGSSFFFYVMTQEGMLDPRVPRGPDLRQVGACASLGPAFLPLAVSIARHLLHSQTSAGAQ